jgi:hypothetical protein
MPDPLDVIRAKAQRHQDEIDRDTRFFTVADLAARWGVSKNTVRAIPADQLPHKNLGSGLVRECRRYHPADVAAYEAARPRRSA